MRHRRLALTGPAAAALYQLDGFRDYEEGRTKFRADFMIPFRRRLRPDTVRPSDGLLIEIDSREFHENQFDRDHERGSTYDALGFHWISVTPNQIEYQPTKVLKALEGASRRAHPPT
jgi:very-short-patch-repair endonuclease